MDIQISSLINWLTDMYEKQMENKKVKWEKTQS